MTIIPLIITGALGRMGRELVIQSQQCKGVELIGATAPPNNPFITQDIGTLVGLVPLKVALSSSLDEIVPGNKIPGIVIIDFTSPQATLTHAQWALDHRASIVIGTTGVNDAERKEIEKLAAKIPIVMAPNMSVGVNTMFKLVADCARTLGLGYDIEVVEAHHRLKKDAPSGTAVGLAHTLAAATGRKYPTDFRFHREGITGERPSHEIGMQVIRGGDIVGEHTVYFCGMGERIEVKHVATSRKIFADGAIRAALWIYRQPPGLYDMRDVLGIPK